MPKGGVQGVRTGDMSSSGEHLDGGAAAATGSGDTMLRNVQRIAGIGAWETNLVEDRVSWSETMFPIFGVDAAAFGGTYREFLALVHPDDRARVSAAAPGSRRREDGGILDVEYRIVRPDGEVRTVHERGEIRFDESGRPVAAAGVVMDVTERRITELALARTSRALRMLSRCNEALVRADDERTLLHEICRIAVDVGGYRMASVLYAEDDAGRRLRPVAYAGHEDGYFSGVNLSWSADRAEGMGPAGRALRSGRPIVVADLAADPDYAPWVQPAQQRGYRSVIALPLKSGERVFGIFGLYSGEVRSIAPDEVELLHELAADLAFGIIGLRVKAERQLLIESTTTIANAASDSTGFAFFERLLKALLECLGAQVACIAGGQPEGEDRVQAVCAVVDGEVVREFQYDLRGTPCEHIGGDDLVVERDVCARYPLAPALAQLRAQAYVGRALFDGAGVRIGTIFVLYREPLRQRDLAVSMLRMFAARVAGEIVRLRDEARLAESEARAAHAQKLEAIGQLTGGIAHDFNNLLTVIIGNAELLSAALDDRPELATMTQMIATAGAQGAELTSRLLAFARRQALEPRIIAPNGIVDGMLALLRRTLGEHVHVEAVLDPQTWPIDADPTQLELAILNLCINARDAMPDGGRLIIETANAVLGQDYAVADFEVVPGEYAMIAVSDTGVGIVAEHLPRVFEPFFTTKPAGKGTGLGLSMVYGFTKQSGGTVRIYSELGAGTVVKLYLPRARGTETGETAPERGDGMQQSRGNEVILLVEDNALVRHFAARLLDELGYRVIAVGSGAEALEVARGDRPIDLLFTDVMMPGGMNGAQLAEQVRRLRPHLPVLYTSGYTENAIVHHARVDAGTILLHKPYDPHALAQKVRQALGGPAGPG